MSCLRELLDSVKSSCTFRNLLLLLICVPFLPSWYGIRIKCIRKMITCWRHLMSSTGVTIRQLILPAKHPATVPKENWIYEAPKVPSTLSKIHLGMRTSTKDSSGHFIDPKDQSIDKRDTVKWWVDPLKERADSFFSNERFKTDA